MWAESVFVCLDIEKVKGNKEGHWCEATVIMCVCVCV